MSDNKNVIVIGAGPIKNAASLHGKDIGYVYVSEPPVELVVDYETLDDGWVKIVVPETWKDKGEAGWIKWSRVSEESGEYSQYLMNVSKDGTVTLRRLK